MDSFGATAESLALDLFSHSQVWVTGVTAATLVYRRDVETGVFVAGALSCAILGRFLKNYFKQSRPHVSPKAHDYGMPSSHAMTIAFFGTHLALTAGLRMGPYPQPVALHFAGVRAATVVMPIQRVVHEVSTLLSDRAAHSAPAATAAASHSSSAQGIAADVHKSVMTAARTAMPIEHRGFERVYATQALVLGLSSAIAWSRVRLRYHTTAQVLAGVGVGVGYALLWFRLSHTFIIPFVANLLSQ
ncbi:hypothetical protein CAOG_01697 [Capsaspora owczarzaki ATCC 30864]|uniref:Dolichyldiphosphatase n=1 Tax=Capsaspora owczarzaki (strain ATCC 30864) TaxID=595528 RepID=A0A0D2WKX7_CAPO3|nr:hypothetical protein CAOG_01697 [Capsaspora owczarzaki ATCC 30864]KJE90378.1 hypothetical protein CAOG_001697 [Capsaspora owczarzaki ATCC 30864]|eukprot:XP_004364565.1 hypothetical protein CAOG_01697 [Capsaspora owczarzaki ATCC 30864]